MVSTTQSFRGCILDNCSHCESWAECTFQGQEMGQVKSLLLLRFGLWLNRSHLLDDLLQQTPIESGMAVCFVHLSSFLILAALNAYLRAELAAMRWPWEWKSENRQVDQKDKSPLFFQQSHHQAHQDINSEKKHSILFKSLQFGGWGGGGMGFRLCSHNQPWMIQKQTWTL